jgi:hypothetical protein
MHPNSWTGNRFFDFLLHNIIKVDDLMYHKRIERSDSDECMKNDLMLSAVKSTKLEENQKLTSIHECGFFYFIFIHLQKLLQLSSSIMMKIVFISTVTT